MTLFGSHDGYSSFKDQSTYNGESNFHGSSSLGLQYFLQNITSSQS